MIIGEFVDTYPPQLDGVGQVTLSYCRTLTEMGHTCYYIAPRSEDSTEYYAFPVLLSESLPFPGDNYRIPLPMLDLTYRRQVDHIDFDIVHAQSPFTAGSEALRIARKRGIPLVTTFHSKYYDDVYGKVPLKLAAQGVVDFIVRFYRKCDAVWTVNNATADVLRGYGYKGDITIMENGTNLEPLKPEGEAALAERFRPAPGVPTLLFVGQHNYKKNLHGILGACSLLHQQGQDFRLVTAGIGPDAEAIREEAKTLGIADKCTFLGFVSDRAMLMALYHTADLLVFPSVYDNAPMVLREAAAMGTPGLLVAGSCAAEGVTDEDNGFICADQSAEAIAQTILRALPRAKEVGVRAQQTIPVRWTDVMTKVLAEYQRLIDRKKEHLGEEQ